MIQPPKMLHFERAPLNEFILGIQFAQPQGYQQIYAGEVRSLYRDDFPFVEEHPAVPPAFETFGLPRAQQIDFGFVSGAAHDRFWFLSPKRNELIQFQSDRFLRNWREIEGQENKYPRFEALIDNFESEVSKLDSYMRRFDARGLQINQAEISYVNHIKSHDIAVEPEEWLTFVRLKNLVSNDFHAGFRQTIYHKDGRALGRIYCDAVTAFEPNGRPFVALTLTARGAPTLPTINGALEFLAQSRERLGKLFLAVTTEAAQQAWGRM